MQRQLATQLRQLREAAGLSLAEVAAQIEVNQGSLSRIENGERGTTPVLVRALLDCALPDFGVALQAEALLAQQTAHRVRADPVSLPSQFGRLVGLCAWWWGEGGRSRTFWPGRYSQDRLALDQTPAATADPADPTQRALTGLRFPHAKRHRALTNACGAGNRPDPAVLERPGLHP
ncbi:helix-turn-helix transcriptional regulator [Streptomyces griseoflavus]